MKKKFLITISLLVYNCFLNAQVLFTDNFDNHSVGNLGTDVTGTIPGQWGWLTYSQNTQSNSFFTIVNETGRGKVLDISTGLTSNEGFIVFKTDLSPLINNRNSSNDVLMFEIDYYTGSKQTAGVSGNACGFGLKGIGDPLALPAIAESLVGFSLEKGTGSILGGFGGGKANVFGDSQNEYYYLPFNTWVKIIVYLDYPNRKGYFHIPYLNKVFVDDFLINKNSASLIQDFIPATILAYVSVISGINNPLTYTRNRYDNIKITALNAVPPNIVTLSVNEQLSAKFNMYPNPASNVVNITNSENMAIQQVAIYDISGKQVSSQNFDSFQEIQVNVENLASGNYMLHLQTNQGTAVKKLVKK